MAIHEDNNELIFQISILNIVNIDFNLLTFSSSFLTGS
jgi:hypothetical protein